MAETNDEILIEIRVSQEDVEKEIIAARQAMAALRKEKQLLDSNYKAGLVTSKEYATETQRLSVFMANAGKAIKDGNKTLSDYAKTQKAAQGSLDQMAAGFILLNQQVRGLSKEERESDFGKNLIKQTRALNEELKENEKALGQNQRNVGNYIRDVNVMGINVGQTADSFKNGAQGVQVFTKAIFTTRGALIALTAIPIVLFLTAIVAFFKSTDEGADKLEQGIAALSAGFDAVLKTLAPLGKLLVDAFLNPIDALKKLGSALLSPIDSLKALANGSKQMAADVSSSFSNAALAAREYTKVVQEVQDAEDALAPRRAAVGLQVDQALLKVKDRTLTEGQRLNILKAAGKAEAELAKASLANAARLLKAAKDQNAALLKNAKDGDIGDAARKKQYDAEADFINAQRDSLNVQQTIQNRRSALLEQEVSSRKEAADKAREAVKRAAQDNVYVAELELLSAKKRGVDLLSYQENLLRKQGELEKAGLGKNSAQRKLIEAKTNADVLALRVEHAAKLVELDFEGQENRLNTQLLLARKGSEEEFKLQQSLLDQRLIKEKTAAVDAAAKNLELRKGLTKQLRLLDAKYNADTEALQNNYAASEINRATELNKLIVQTELDRADDITAIRRNLAVETIELEENQQLELLKLQDIDADERATREAAIIARAENARKAVYRQIQADRRADSRSEIETELTVVREGTNREFELRRSLLRLQRDDELANTELGEKQKEAIRAKYRKAERDLQKAHTQQIVDLTVDIVNKSTQTLDNLVTATAGAQLSRLDDQQKAILASTALSADQRAAIEEKFQKRREKIEKTAAEKRRKIASIENIINTASAITKAFAQGGIAGPIFAAIALAQGIAQQIVIDNAKYARGGVIDGPSHAEGGVKYRMGRRTVELEGGEGVINKRSMSMPGVREQASRLNQLGGGVSFSKIGNTALTRSYTREQLMPKFQYGGTISAAVDAAEMANAFRSAVADLKIYTAITDIRREDAKMTYAEVSGDI